MFVSNLKDNFGGDDKMFTIIQKVEPSCRTLQNRTDHLYQKLETLNEYVNCSIQRFFDLFIKNSNEEKVETQIQTFFDDTELKMAEWTQVKQFADLKDKFSDYESIISQEID